MSIPAMPVTPHMPVIVSTLAKRRDPPADGGNSQPQRSKERDGVASEHHHFLLHSVEISYKPPSLTRRVSDGPKDARMAYSDIYPLICPASPSL